VVGGQKRVMEMWLDTMGQRKKQRRVFEGKRKERCSVEMEVKRN